MKKSKGYYVSFNTSSDDKNILLMLNTIGKYLVTNTDKLLNAKTKTESWRFDSSKGKKCVKK